VATLVIALWLRRGTGDSFTAGPFSAWANAYSLTASYVIPLEPSTPSRPDREWKGVGVMTSTMNFPAGSTGRIYGFSLPHWLAFSVLAIPPALATGWWLVRRGRARRGRGFDVQPRTMEQQA
jgi:hypothetical protein